MRRALLTATALILALGVAAACRDDDDDGSTVAQTATAAETAAKCPEFTTQKTGTVTDIRSSVDCGGAEALAGEVLSRDDCVEETPSGSNVCEAQGYNCTTSVSRGSFSVSCHSGADVVEFRQILPTGQPAPG